MTITLIRVYDDLSVAESTRVELLRAGFEMDAVQLAAKEDEAGPVQGSFILEMRDSPDERNHKFFRNLFPRMQGAQGLANRHPRALCPGSYLLTVDAGDDDQYLRATAIINRFGAVDVESRTAAAGL
jgi:hypothetical protein